MLMTMGEAVCKRFYVSYSGLTTPPQTKKTRNFHIFTCLLNFFLCVDVLNLYLNKPSKIIWTISIKLHFHSLMQVSSVYIYSYHQKYILRRHTKVLDRLNLTDEELIKSKTACRLNGYLAGYGTEEDFLKV